MPLSYLNKFVEYLGEVMGPTCPDEDDIETPCLTKREKEIATSMLRLNNVKSVAGELNITSHAVDYHCRNIRKKLKEAKTLPAVLKARDLGLI